MALFIGKFGCRCEQVTHTLIISANQNNRLWFFFLQPLSFQEGGVEIQSGKGQKDEIESSTQWLCDYKSTNQTDGGQMGAELTEHPFHNTWWGLMFKRWTHSGWGSR